MVTIDEEGEIFGVRWLAIPRDRYRQRMISVVLGAPDAIGVWHVNGTAAAWRVLGLWVPEWGQVVPVVRFAPGWPEAYGPFRYNDPYAAWPSSDEWRRYVFQQGWVTPEEWTAWTNPCQRTMLAQRWPKMLWMV